MTAKYYQELAARTLLVDPGFTLTPEEISLSWNAHCLAGEAGEVAEIVKKGIYHRQGISRDNLRKELGDVLWYVAAICSHTGIPLEEVMETNIEKLRERYPDGYSPEASAARVDVKAEPELDELDEFRNDRESATEAEERGDASRTREVTEKWSARYPQFFENPRHSLFRKLNELDSYLSDIKRLAK